MGKTTFCEELSAQLNLTHVEVGKLVREQKLYKEWDDDMDCSIFDEDMVCDALESVIENGNCEVDFHSSGFLPEDWFDLVIVLRADTNELYKRLENRHYAEAKIKQNVEAEIFQTCLEEAREAFEESSVEVLELQHNSQTELEDSLSTVRRFVEKFNENN